MKCNNCGNDISLEARRDNDGDCPLCNAEIELDLVVETQTNKLVRYERFLKGIRPYLLAEGYTGFVENIDELLGDNHG